MTYVLCTFLVVFGVLSLFVLFLLRRHSIHNMETNDSLREELKEARAFDPRNHPASHTQHGEGHNSSPSA
jgi:hypothetical protein